VTDVAPLKNKALVRLCTTSILALLFLGSCLSLADALFTGNSLDGWQAVGEARWVVEQGDIVAQGAGEGYLISDGVYGDFHLTLEFWVDATTNSGVFIRCQERDNIHPDTCYELNIWDDHPRQEARTGSIVFKAMPPLAQVQTIGKWNTLDVLARAASLQVMVNGVVTATMDDALPAPGFIALQHFVEGTVRFRNIQLDDQVPTI
jgi:hypothetical protein